MEANQKTRLILTGGGARAAYQVGVPASRNPFDIICATSTGAMNATALACQADHFQEGMQVLLDFWQHCRVEQVYRADSLGVIRSSAKWLSLLSFGWLLRKWHASPPSALLDNTLLHRLLDLPRLDRALTSGALQALAVRRHLIRKGAT